MKEGVRLLRRATAVGSLLGLVGGQSAVADTKSSEPTIFNSDNGSQCIKQKAQIWESGSSSNEPNISTTTSSKRRDFFVNCLLAKNRPQWALGSWTSLLVGPGSQNPSNSGPYSFCWMMDSATWVYNGPNTASIRVEHGFSGPPCGGNRWYKSGPRSKWYFDGGYVDGQYYSAGYWYEDPVFRYSPAHTFGAAK